MKGRKELLIGIIIIGTIVMATIGIIILLLMSPNQDEEKPEINEVVPSIILDKTEIEEEILKGEVKEICLVAATENITEELIWTCDNEKVATIEIFGNEAKIFLKEAGEATITVTDGKITKTCKILVKQVVGKIILEPEAMQQSIEKGKEKTITIVSALKNIVGDIVWKSSDEKVATVIGTNEMADITLKSAGKVIITATADDVTAECHISVVETQKEVIEPKITLTKTSITEKIVEGKTKAINLVANLENINKKDIKWQSTDTKIAALKVDGNKAVVTLKGKGTATITVTDKASGKKATCKITVLAPKLSINEKEIIINKGEIVTLTTDVENINASNLKWSMDGNTGILERVNTSNNGSTYKVKALKGGMVTITVTDSETGLIAKSTVKVRALNICEASNCSDNIVIYINKEQSKTIETKALYIEGLKWTSSNNEIVSVSSNGIVTGKKVGEAIITVTSGTLSARCTVRVRELSVDGKTVNKGETSALVVTKQNIGALSWKSSNTAIATVDSNGKVTGIKGGTATITATDGNISATCTVKVREINIKESTVTVGKDKKIALKLSVNENTGGITWTSSDTSIATVNNSGEVTGISGGTATITATSKDSQDIKDVCEVKVSSLEIKDSTLIKDGVLTINKSEKVYTIGVIKQNTGTLSWTSSNPSIATVDSNGRINILKGGTVTITVTDGNVSADCTVKIVSLDIKEEKVVLNKNGRPVSTILTLAENTNAGDIVWTSSVSGVVTGVNGTVIARNVGTTTITVYSKANPEVKDTCTVVVKELGFAEEEVYMTASQAINLKIVASNNVEERYLQCTPNLYDVLSVESINVSGGVTFTSGSRFATVIVKLEEKGTGIWDSCEVHVINIEPKQTGTLKLKRGSSIQLISYFNTNYPNGYGTLPIEWIFEGNIGVISSQGSNLTDDFLVITTSLVGGKGKIYAKCGNVRSREPLTIEVVE